jgi:3-oxoacyl-(acyl-carrier-protein) synthase
MNAYINGTGILSAQRTFDGGVLQQGFTGLNGNRIAAVEPDYKDFIDARQIRRMSRIIRMGVVAATLASRESGMEKPDGVITGTAFGCLEDTYSFLSKLVQYNEEMLSPTAFIHSTHNTISSQIALWFQCRGYNSTYVHRAQSFESALLDSMMLLEEGAAENILTGGIDEIIDASFTIMDRMDYFRKDAKPGKGVAGSEGAAFFALSSKATASSYAQIKGVELFSYTDSGETLHRIREFLAAHQAQPDLIFSGHNGDTENDSVYDLLLDSLSYRERVIKYKQWCGEYATASAFGTWLAAEIIRNNKLLPVLNSIKFSGTSVKSVLLYNHLEGKHHSLILLGPC